MTKLRSWHASYERMLKQADGVQVVTAQTVERALQLLNDVDGVIADCVMPDIQLFNEFIKRSGKPVIRMSGKVDRATNLVM